MLGMGWVEIFLIVVIALLAVGPEKLPEVARSMARLIRQVQRVVGELRDTVNLEEFDAQVRQSGTAHMNSELTHYLGQGESHTLTENTGLPNGDEGANETATHKSSSLEKDRGRGSSSSHHKTNEHHDKPYDRNREDGMRT